MIFIPILLLLAFVVIVYLIATRLLPVARLLFIAMTPEERALALLLTAIAMVIAALSVAALRSAVYDSPK